MKPLFKIVTLLFCFFILYSCAPQSKDQYIRKYTEFIETVSISYESFSEADWEKQIQKLELYSGEYYENFKDELSVSEKMKLSTFPIRFYYYMGIVEVTEEYQLFKNEFNKYIDSLIINIDDSEYDIQKEQI